MMTLVGCDFSSSPSRKKPIVMALGSLRAGCVVLAGLERLVTLDDFSCWLQQPRSWVGGFDLPFGLPRELLETLGWPLVWEASIRHYATLSRQEIRQTFASFCDARPAGGKFAHRQTDLPAGSSPSMKWVNPPVAFMLHAGVPRLLDAGVILPGLHQPLVAEMAQDSQPGAPSLKVALEAYPGLVAREVLDRRSYKSDDRSKQTPERLIARKDLITALEHGAIRLGLRLKLTHAQRDLLVDDASGDSLDAVLCLMQAAWAYAAHLSGHPCYGLPGKMDRLEGWILGVE